MSELIKEKSHLVGPWSIAERVGDCSTDPSPLPVWFSSMLDGWWKGLIIGAVVAAGCNSTVAGTTTTATTADIPTTTSSPAVTVHPTTTLPYVPPEHRITIRDGVFVDDETGGPFVPRGVDYFVIRNGRDRVIEPGVFDAEQMDADFAVLAERGYNTVRLFFDSCGCMGKTSGMGLRDDTLDTLAETIALAKKHGLVLLLTSNDLPDEGGYRRLAGQDDSEFFPGYRNSDFLTSAGHQAIRTYWDDLLTGLVERRAPLEAVLGWSILNEQWLFTDQPPLSLTDGIVMTATGTYDLSIPDQKRAMVIDAVRALASGVADVIKTHDPAGLVTMGFFSPQFPNETGIGGTWYVDTAPLVEDSDLDFFDFHAYPGEDIGIGEIGENFGITDGKPVIMGEVGAFIHRYSTVERAGLVVQRWIADSCAAGFDGWLYWGYFRAPLSDATWGLTDADGFLLDALSPVAQPDPCEPTLVDPNLAAGRPTRASHQLADQPASAAVDGDPTTSWSSGADAPGWLEVELDGVTVGSVRLTVAQWPAGRTVHRVVLFTSGGGSIDHTFDGDTADSDVLDFELDEPLAGVVKVRIETSRSPSWVAWYEVEVLGP